MQASAPSAERLLALARDRSAERRTLLSLALVDLFRDGDSVLTDRERTMMTEILRRLLSEMETDVRRTVAERLATNPNLSKTLARDLANDTIEVAWPILRHSLVLDDLDLIEVVRERTLEHRLAIAQRGVLSEAVADALVRRDEENVLVALLNNPNAQLSAAAMDYLTEQSRRVDSFQEPLLHRRELTPDLAKRMFAWVSAALRDHIIARFSLDPQTVDELLDGAITTLVVTPPEPGKDALLVDAMNGAEMVVPSLMVRALRAGQVKIYSLAVERLTGIRRQLAVRFLFEAAGESLAVQCRAVDLPKDEFLEIYTIARKARPVGEDQLQADRDRLSELYGAITSDAARAVVLRWQRSPDYLAALRALDPVMHV